MPSSPRWPTTDTGQFAAGAAIAVVVAGAGALVLPFQVGVWIGIGVASLCVWQMQRAQARVSPVQRVWHALPQWARSRTAPLIAMDESLHQKLLALRDERRRTAGHLGAAELESLATPIALIESKRRAILTELTALGETIRLTSSTVEPRALPSDLDRARFEEDLADVQVLREALREVAHDHRPGNS